MVFATPSFIALVLASLSFILLLKFFCGFVMHPWEVSVKLVTGLLYLSADVLNTPLRILLAVRLLLAPFHCFQSFTADVVPFILCSLAWNDKVHFGSLCSQISFALVFYLSAGSYPWWCVKALCLWELLWPTFGKRPLDSHTAMQKVQKILKKVNIETFASSWKSSVNRIVKRCCMFCKTPKKNWTVCILSPTGRNGNREWWNMDEERRAPRRGCRQK